MDPIPTPHDSFFREGFGRTEIAQDFLRHHLPAALLDEIDLATLTVAQPNFNTPIYSSIKIIHIQRTKSPSGTTNAPFFGTGRFRRPSFALPPGWGHCPALG